MSAAKLIGDSESSRSDVVTNGNCAQNKIQQSNESTSNVLMKQYLVNPSETLNQTARCICYSKDNDNGEQPSQELRKEKFKIDVNCVDELFTIDSDDTLVATSTVNNNSTSHKMCRCKCDKQKSAVSTAATNGESSVDNDDWSLMLIGLAQLHPATSLVRLDPFDALPSISVVPPTPEGMFAQFCGSPNFEHSRGFGTTSNVKRGRVDQVIEQANDATPDDSPQDEEPPYRSLNATLKRYGTLSSLERVSSDEKDEKAYNSSEEETDFKGDEDSKFLLQFFGEWNISNNICILLQRSVSLRKKYTQTTKEMRRQRRTGLTGQAHFWSNHVRFSIAIWVAGIVAVSTTNMSMMN